MYMRVILRTRVYLSLRLYTYTNDNTHVEMYACLVGVNLHEYSVSHEFDKYIMMRFTFSFSDHMLVFFLFLVRVA